MDNDVRDSRSNWLAVIIIIIIIIIIILSCLTSLDSSKPFQKRISGNHEGLSTPITT